MSKKFGDIFSAAVDMFKENFSVFVSIGFLTYFIPQFLSFLSTEYKWNMGIDFFVTVLLFVTTSFFLIFIIKTLDGKTKDVKKESWKILPRFVLFELVITIFLMGLSLLLIVPGIIFSIFWIFASIIFILDENGGIKKSLEQSHNCVKGKWWRIFGMQILFYLIIILFGMFIFVLIYLIPSVVVVGVLTTLFAMIFYILSACFIYSMYKEFCKYEEPKKIKVEQTKKVKVDVVNKKTVKKAKIIKSKKN